ncbi:MAG: GAF and ANTAR domain-containing protein [Herbiconiux sp.]|nr:GAF and ANTAR domain-containing protein [Herbiconiux sp.]
MTAPSREAQLLRTFATLADTLVAGYDVVDLLQYLVERCGELLGSSAAGILLADARGDLELVVSTSEASRLVETMQLSADAGPCIDSFTTGQVVSLDEIRDAPETWVRFRDSALELGFRAIDAIPLRLRSSTIGTLNLLRDEPGALPADDLVAAQAFADVATIGVLQERTIREGDLVREQLQNALNSRIVIEQAKGVVAHTKSVSPDEAFPLIRAHARANRLPLSVVAARIVDRSLSI